MAQAIIPDYGRGHAAYENPSTSSAEAGNMVRNDCSTRGSDCNPQGQPIPGANTTNPMAASDGQGGSNSKSSWSADANVLIVDLEGFQIKKDFFIKEIAFFNPNTMQCWSGLFKSPFDKQFLKKKGITAIEYATKYLHGLKWDDGDYPYSMIFQVVSHFGRGYQLYSKGSEKCGWLQQFTSLPVINLELYGCPPAKELPHGCMCIHHNSLEKSCAIDKSVKFGLYLSKLYHLHDVAVAVNIKEEPEQPEETELIF